MRILHIDSEQGFRGGQRQVQLLVEGLARRGHQSLLIGPEGSDLVARLSAAGHQTSVYTKPGILGIHSPRLAAQMRHLADRFRPDIVHAHSGKAHTLALAAFGGRLPVLSTRRVDFAVDGWLRRRKYLRPGQHFIAISGGVRDALLAAGVSPERIDTVFSGVEVERVTGGNGAALRREWLGDRQGPVIGFMGALVDHKAPWILAEAAPLIARRLPGARVVFVGEGDERPRLEALANVSNGSVLLAGWRNDVADCYAAFDLFVMPSKLEGLCTALVDALAAGVPAVASRAGGIPDVVVNDVTGVLAPPLDAAALADAIVALWQDADRRARLVAAGRERVQRHFTADSMVDGNLAVYTKMVAGAGRG